MRQLALVAVLMLGACGGEPEPTLVTDGTVTCDHDKSTSEAKSTVEVIGGRRSEGVNVRLARSTEAGIVAILEADDFEDAAQRLIDDDGVSVVRRWEPELDELSAQLDEVDRIVADLCRDGEF